MNQISLMVVMLIMMMVALVLAIRPIRDHRWVSLTIALGLLVFGVGGYWQLGSFKPWREYQAQLKLQMKAKAILKTISGPEEVIERLKQRLQEEPNSARGWYLLGRMYASQTNWKEARDAFTKAYDIDPSDDQLVVNYAQSLWYANHQQYNQAIIQLFEQVLNRNPDQLDALAMMAMASFQQKQYQQAINYWQRLLKLTPAQSEDSASIRKAIVRAKQRLSV